MASEFAFSPWLWPFLLSAALLSGIVISIACLDPAARPRLGRMGVEPIALTEAFIAISSGALLWIGWWDLLESYLVPQTWWAKLCMIFVGAIGALATRSLYAEPVHVHSIKSADGTSMLDAVEEGLETPRRTAPALPEAFSPRPRTLGLVDDEEDAAHGVHRTPARGGKQRARAAATRSVAGGEESCWSRHCFLQPPRFSASRCGRALLATFSGLTMWVGLWDLLDEHLLPTMFTSCAHEPATGCAVVKLSLLAIGALGLYVTRSLYGDQGTVVQFQRL